MPNFVRALELPIEIRVSLPTYITNPKIVPLVKTVLAQRAFSRVNFSAIF
jgi:hypothetical protein